MTLLFLGRSEDVLDLEPKDNNLCFIYSLNSLSFEEEYIY